MGVKWLGEVQLAQGVWQGRGWEGRGDAPAPENIKEKNLTQRTNAGERNGSVWSNLQPSPIIGEQGAGGRLQGDCLYIREERMACYHLKAQWVTGINVQNMQLMSKKRKFHLLSWYTMINTLMQQLIIMSGGEEVTMHNLCETSCMMIKRGMTAHIYCTIIHRYWWLISTLQGQFQFHI